MGGYHQKNLSIQDELYVRLEKMVDRLNDHHPRSSRKLKMQYAILWFLTKAMDDFDQMSLDEFTKKYLNLYFIDIDAYK